MMNQGTSAAGKVVLLKDCDIETSVCKSGRSGNATNTSAWMIFRVFSWPLDEKSLTYDYSSLVCRLSGHYCITVDVVKLMASVV